MMLSGAVSSELDAFWCAVMSPSSDLDVLNDASAQPAEAEAPRRRHSAAVTTKDVKPRRAAPTAAKARLRSYERRSRSKRERTMLTMKERVAVLESRLQERCASEPREHLLQHKIMALAMEATTLSHDNHELRKVLDEHEFFHVMLQLEYDHRETTSDSVTHKLLDTHAPWRCISEAMCLRIMHDSCLEIAVFSTSDDFVSSGLEICGWHEKRKLEGHNVNFMFHKRFATECSDELAARSWEMRAVQDQVTRFFGHSLEVKVEVLQRFANDVVVVRRKIKHTLDGWEHHTIYLLFRTETPDGHLVCIRDMNPIDADELQLMAETTITPPARDVIWSKAFIWWKFTTLVPEVGAEQLSSGFEVEYGGLLGYATEADAAFWMREVLVLALRWENLVVGPLITLD
uniref:Uncharacterized protein n=1 Tax=Hyaloperonospora arabidopsidis (strain Emoy2) TaxID=559515 RepID=M4BQU1_HYAAE